MTDVRSDRGEGDVPSIVAERRFSRSECVALVAVVAAFVVGAVVALRAGWLPVSDEALIELAVRDVPSHLPLVGVYSRFGWSHPGPLEFWLLAVPYRISGSNSAAMLAAMLAGHVAALFAAWWLARRIDRVAGWAVLIALLAVVATTPADLVRTPWNPYLALVAAGTLVVAAWATAERSGAGVITLVVVSSLLVQAHVVTAPVVASVVVCAAVLALWRRSEPTAPAVPWRAVAFGGVVGALLWIGPVVDQLTSDRPNATFLGMTSSDGSREGLSSGLGVLSQSFAPWPSWIRPAAVTQVLVDASWAVPVWLCVPLAGLVVAAVCRNWPFVRGLVVAGAALAGSVLTTSMLTGGLFNYLIVENRAVVATSMAIGVASLAQLLPAARRVRLEVPAAAVVVALAVVIGVRQLDGANPQQRSASAVEALSQAAAQRFSRDETLEISSAIDFRALELTPAIMLQLERAGFTVKSSQSEARRVGEHRTIDAGGGDVELLVAPVTSAADLESEGWTILEAYQPLSAATQAQIAELTAERDAISTELEGDLSASARRDAFDRVLKIADRIDELGEPGVPMLLAYRAGGADRP